MDVPGVDPMICIPVILRLAVNLLPFSHSTMIPPCDPSILEQNPQFKRLYENLTNNLLTPDGSTRANADSVRETVVEVRRDASDISSSRMLFGI